MKFDIIVLLFINLIFLFRCRENSSSLGVLSDSTTKNFIDETQGLTRDFLKLAPPQPSQSQLSSKEKLPSLCIGEQPQFEILPPHNVKIIFKIPYLYTYFYFGFILVDVIFFDFYLGSFKRGVPCVWKKWVKAATFY